jgi:hypothetical protein
MHHSTGQPSRYNARYAGYEITMLQLAGRRGCAGLLRHDAAPGALLLERLGPSLYELSRPFAQRLENLAATAAAMWRPAAGYGFLPERTRPAGSSISSPPSGRS